MAQPLLESHVVEDDRDTIIRQLRTDKSDLQEQVQALVTELKSSKREFEHAATALRRTLQPLYDAMRMVFGDLDVVAPEGESASPVNSKVSAVWHSWIQKLPGKRAEVIQALLEHGEMTIPQLRVATHSGNQTMYDVTSQLNRLGLLNKNGGKYSLKTL